MRYIKPVYIFFLILISSTYCFSDGLTGKRTINGGLTGPKNFKTLRAALDTLNKYGVGEGGVEFEFGDAHMEYAPIGGFYINVTGTKSNPIIFKGPTNGNKPTLIAPIGVSLANGNSPDGILKISGGDYITLINIKFIESDLNLTQVHQMEFGVGFFFKDPYNGCQNNTIKNCEFKLTRTNSIYSFKLFPSGCTGIVFVNSIANYANTPIKGLGNKSSNSFNTIDNNLISNCINGIAILGTEYNSGSNFSYDNNNSIVNNKINSFGNGVMYESHCNGILLQHQKKYIIENNTIETLINADTVGTFNFLYGINSTSLSTNSGSINIKNNYIKLRSNDANRNIYGMAITNGDSLMIEKNTFDSIILTSTQKSLSYNLITNANNFPIYYLSIINNTFKNSYFTSTLLNSMYSVYSSNNKTSKISNNNFISNCEGKKNFYNSLYYGIYCQSETAVINNNYFTSDTSIKTNITRSYYSIYLNCSKYGNIYNNVIDNLNVNTTDYYGIITANKKSDYDIHHNRITNVYGESAHTRAIKGIGYNCNIYNNYLNNIKNSYSSFALVYGIEVDSVINLNLYNNSISNLKTPLTSYTASNNPFAVVGITLLSSIINSNYKVYNNSVYLNTTSSGANFGSACLYQFDFPFNNNNGLQLNNNLFINKSTPNGSGRTVAIFRDTNKDNLNLSTSSNNNLLYAGIPNNKKFLYATPYKNCQTLASFKLLMNPRENLSFTENVTFKNPENGDLGIADGTSTLAESNGHFLPYLRTDFSDQQRPGIISSANNSGGGIDIGAFEFDGIDLMPYGNIRTPIVYLDSISPNLGQCSIEQSKASYSIYCKNPLTSTNIYLRSEYEKYFKKLALTKLEKYKFTINFPTKDGTQYEYYLQVIDSFNNTYTSDTILFTSKGYNVVLKPNNKQHALGDTLEIVATITSNIKIGHSDLSLNYDRLEAAVYNGRLDAYSQLFIIRADELRTAGMQAGYINSIGFFVNKVGLGNFAILNNFTLSIAPTSDSKLIENTQYNFMDVWTGTDYLPTYGLNTHVFNQKYFWDGQNNLVIKCCIFSTQSGYRTFLNSSIVNSSIISDSISALKLMSHTGDICSDGINDIFSNIRPNVFFSSENAYLTGNWNCDSSGGMVSQTNTQLIAKPTNLGVQLYYFESLFNGCTKKDSFAILVYEKPSINLGPDITLCNGDTLELDAYNPGCNYSWYFNSIYIGSNRILKITQAGIYKIIVSDSNGKTASDSIEIINVPSISFDLGGTKNLCIDDSLTLDVGLPGLHYLWSTGDTTQSIKIKSDGTYFVKVSNDFGCIKDDEVSIITNPKPSSDFTIELITQDLSYTFRALGIIGNTFLWDFGDPLSTSNTSQLANPTHQFTSHGIYKVSLTVYNVVSQCSSTSTIDLSTYWGIDELKNKFKLNINQNPITSNSTLSYTPISNNSNVSLYAYDLYGRKMITYLENEKQHNIPQQISLGNLINLPSSIFILKLIIDDVVISEKVYTTSH